MLDYKLFTLLGLVPSRLCRCSHTNYFSFIFMRLLDSILSLQLTMNVQSPELEHVLHDVPRKFFSYLINIQKVQFGFS